MRELLLLAAVPFAMVVIGAQFYELLAPIYSGPVGYDQDPAYVYLLNGLSLLAGSAPGHIDHPGTPLQLFIAVFVPIWALLTSPEAFSGGLIDSVLSAPEHYIKGISLALLLLNALCFLYAGVKVFIATGNMLLGLAFQLTPLLFGSVTPRLFYLSPEAFLMAFSAVLVGILAPAIFKPGEASGAASGLARNSGIVLGLALATKFTFLPLLGLLGVFWSWKKIARGLTFTAVTFFLALAPIWTQLPRFARWIWDIVFHTEHYGRGAPGLIDLAAVPGRLSELNHAFPLYFAVMAALAVVLVSVGVSRFATHLGFRVGQPVLTGENPGILAPGTGARHPAKLSAVLLLVLCAQTLIVLKHFGWHYLLPALPVSVIALTWMARLTGSLPGGRVLARVLSLLLVLSFLALSARQLVDVHAELSPARAQKDSEVEVILDELRRHRDPIIVGAYRCTLPQCALDFGFGYTLGFNARYAPAHLENFYSFNIWNQKLFSYAESGFGWLEPDVVREWLAEGRTVLLVSPEYEQLEVFEMHLLSRGGSGYWSPVNVYRVTGIRQQGR